MSGSVPVRPAAALLAFAAIGLAACGGPSAAASTHAGAAVVPLVVYSAQGYDSTVVTAFSKATGIPTKLDDDSTGPLLTKVAAERSNPQWGVLWVDGDEAFAALDRQGQLLPYTPPVTLDAAGRSLTPADHSYIPVSTTLMPAVIYRSGTTPPTSLAQLLTPAFHAKVGMNNPAISGPTFPFVAGVMSELGGQGAGERFFTALKANGLQVFNTNGDTLHALETGQISYGLIQSSAAIGAAMKASGLAVAYLPHPTLLPGVIGIDKGAPPAEQREAERFVRYVLSPAGQAQMQLGDPTGDSLFWPVVPGIKPLSALPTLATISYQKINPYLWGPRESEINTWFTNTIVQ